ncbi:MAG: hypothetical protein ACLPY5_15555 [Candidatus Bathyarchaeia archaeon]
MNWLNLLNFLNVLNLAVFVRFIFGEQKTKRTLELEVRQLKEQIDRLERLRPMQ